MVKDGMNEGIVMCDNIGQFNKEQERKRIGRRIAEIRKRVEWTDNQGVTHTGMTQGELAERCGLAQSHIARIEAGRYSVGFDTLQQIAEAFGAEVDIVRPFPSSRKK